MKQLWKLVLAATAAASLAACTSTPENTAQVEDRNATTATNAAGTQGTGTTTAGVGTGTGVAGNSLQGNANNAGANNAGNSALRDPRSPLSRREIFYDLDSFTVKDEYKPLLEAHAAYLKSNRNARIKVEGNTDERGSREYNLALGQKRSESVKRVLMLLGVSEAQIDTVSFGEEKPRNTAANDAAYSENRRCDLAYAGE
ncbi:MAG TPA: peptidoglycan-associated lipoprotein Pal [Casimicrobium sp.]|nr:peptidoglycan-associated lipoprotein Pal [Casimicrobium sp.]